MGDLYQALPIILSYNPREHTTKIKSNIVSSENNLYTEHEYQTLQSFFVDEKLVVVTKNWQLNSSENNYLDSMDIIGEKSILLKQDTVGLTEKKEWLLCKKS